MSDLISRQAAIELLSQYPFEKVINCISILEEMPSAQPKPDEWCTDCKEYDSEKHCCPRFNRVIRNALKDAQPEPKKGKWIIRDNPGTGWYRVTCSECGEDVTSTIPMIGFFPNAKPLWDYCPYCGCKMEG